MRKSITFLMRVTYYFFRQRRFNHKSWFGFREEFGYVEKIRQHGFAVLENYKTREWCEDAKAQILATDHSRTETDEDVRIFGAEKLIPQAKEFGSDKFLAQIASMYAGDRESLLFCMANHLTDRPGKYGSGGEWHRDGFREEIKALIYLTDVTDKDGPFGLVERSHRRIFRHSIRMAWWIFRGKELSATRLRDAGEKIGARKFLAKAGTVILFDASSIHTGFPVDGGERFAFTNYYCPTGKLETHIAYYRDRVTLT